MEGELSFYRVSNQFNGGRIHVMDVSSLIKGEWSCYRCSLGEIGYRASLMEEKMVMSDRGGQFNGGRMVMLQRWPV